MHYISHIPGELEALPFPRRVALMGCTGSIGCSTLRVLEAWKDSGKFHVEVLAAGRNIALLAVHRLSSVARMCQEDHQTA